MRKYSKIGILGGSFNPIHLGHTAIAQMAAEELGLDLALFLPTRVNPLKGLSTDSTPQNRLAMVKEATANNNLFEICEKELEMPAPSYTINTVTQLFKEFSADEWFFLIGSDNLPSFTQWNKWEELIQKVKLAVCYRPDFPMIIPENLPSDRVVFFEGPNWGISSSQIRKRISENKSCRYLLKSKVRKFICENNLYKGSEKRLCEKQ
jgi:nicotinate-nucleotide adenylyltransferase